MWILLIIIIILIAIFIIIFKNKIIPDSSHSQDSINIPLPDFATKDPITGKISLSIGFENSKFEKGIFLIVDTETTGLPINRNAKPEEINNWPRILQIS